MGGFELRQGEGIYSSPALLIRRLAAHPTRFIFGLKLSQRETDRSVLSHGVELRRRDATYVAK